MELAVYQRKESDISGQIAAAGAGVLFEEGKYFSTVDCNGVLHPFRNTCRFGFSRYVRFAMYLDINIYI
jgi:hypothetical protein